MKSTSKFALALATGLMLMTGPMVPAALGQEGGAAQAELPAALQADIDEAVEICSTGTAEECADALDALFAELPGFGGNIDTLRQVVAEAVVNSLSASSAALDDAAKQVVAQAIVYVANTQMPAGAAQQAARNQAVAIDPAVNTASNSRPTTPAPGGTGTPSSPQSGA